MILEYKLDYRSPSLVYEKIFLNQLEASNLKGNIAKDGFELKLFVEAKTTEELEEFATNFANALPHSIFLHSTEATMVEEMPSEPYVLREDKRLPSPPCPKCLKELEESYNIFTQCDVCGYDTEGDERSYKVEFMETAQKIKEGKIVELNTFYGKYFIGLPSAVCNDIVFDILAYDLATIEKYANVEECELNALASFEKPKIRLKKKMKFVMDYEEVESELIHFRLPDDAVLYLLMQELHTMDVDALFISKERVETNETLLLAKAQQVLEPLEVVASPKHILVLGGNRGLATISKNKNINPEIEGFYSVIEEHNLKYDNIAGLNLNRGSSNIIVQGEKFGLIEYLSFETSFDSIADIFTQIASADEQSQRLLENYKNKFADHYEKISDIRFDDNRFSIYRLWGVVAIILDFAQTTDPLEGSRILEDGAMGFLGDRGVRIDYKLVNAGGKPSFDPLMTIRTAMSFKLAGVDELGLCYGVIESFLEFLTNELDGLRETMGIEAVVITGTLLSNRRIFSKISQEVSMNHEVFFGEKLPL